LAFADSCRRHSGLIAGSCWHTWRKCQAAVKVARAGFGIHCCDLDVTAAVTLTVQAMIHLSQSYHKCTEITSQNRFEKLANLACAFFSEEAWEI